MIKTRIKLNKLAALSLASLVIISLSGCSSSADVATEEPKVKTSLEFTVGDAIMAQDSLELTETIVVLSSSEAEVLLYGSSSCPPVIEKIMSTEDNVLEFEIKKYDGACTADYAPYPTKITVKNTDLTIKDFLVCEYDNCREVQALNFAN
jgi:ABC-type Fe3+-hydroxamate transport system substrate-binding protein